MTAVIDLASQRFGRLEVIGRDPAFADTRKGGARWLCRCDCGNVRSIRSGFLRRPGGYTSCGCMKGTPRIDIAGHRFGMLVAIEAIEEGGGKYKKTRWRCRCDCGNETVVFTDNLRNGTSKSCGCSILKKRDPRTPFRLLVSSYRKTAEKRGLEWCLSDQQAESLFQSACHYCGSPPSNRWRSRRSDYTYSGIDRTDNSSGYTDKNCVPCCRTCNFAKGKMGYGEFRAWLNRASKHIAAAENMAEEAQKAGLRIYDWRGR